MRPAETKATTTPGRVAIGLLLFIGAATAQAGPPAGSRGDGGIDWTGFLGPRGEARSPETGIRTDWSDGLPLLWHKAIGDGYGMPSIADGRLFLFDRHGDEARLTCMKPGTGEELWRAEYTTDYEDMYEFSNGPRAVPVVDGDRVYTFGVEGRLRCHRVADGKLLWDVDTTAKYGVVQNFFGAGSTPVVEGDLLIVPVGGSLPDSPGARTGETRGAGSGIVAFDKRSGEERYAITDELASYSSPVLATIGERRWGFHLARGGLVGFEPAGGKVDFHFPWRAKKVESVNAANPVVVGDTVFITETYGPGSALLRVRPGGYEVVWKDGKGRDKSLLSHWSTPVYHEGHLYGSSGRHTGNAELRAVEHATGKVKWSHPGLGRSTLLYADGHLIVLTEHGRLLLVKAVPEKYEAVAEVVLEAALGDGGPKPLIEYPAWNAPVLSHGLLYVRGKDRLACVELIPWKAGSVAGQ
jgi:outer membrane protein assembly factor BamB